MRIAVLRETGANERRVALVPDGVARLVRASHAVTIQAGAGSAAGYADDAYASHGATVAEPAAGALQRADALVTVGVPSVEALDALPRGAMVVGFLDPWGGRTAAALAERGLTGFAMELVPRSTRAQSMDALSSQATVAGYKAVILGASLLPRFLPMLTTAAGTVTPARVFVIGAGVAGLQAIATARRLGAVVSAFDVRPVVQEQVESLGASFLAVPSVAAEGEGGYARELEAEQQQRVATAIADHVKGMDLVITTAQIPGRPAPRILSADMVRSLKAGSVVVDLAAESGGNTELTRGGETVVDHGVTIAGPVALAATVPAHASQMYSRNVQTFLEYLAPGGALTLSLDDPIAGAMCIAHAGAVRNGGPHA